MASLTNIILQKAQVLVQQTLSPSGITANNTEYIFGYVWNVYQTSDKTFIGQTVLFNPNKSIPIKFAGVNYYLTDESQIFTRESGAAP